MTTGKNAVRTAATPQPGSPQAPLAAAIGMAEASASLAARLAELAAAWYRTAWELGLAVSSPGLAPASAWPAPPPAVSARGGAPSGPATVQDLARRLFATGLAASIMPIAAIGAAASHSWAGAQAAADAAAADD